MKKEESHPIRNSVIAALIAAAVLAVLTEIAPIIKNVPLWFWDKTLWGLGFFVDGYKTPGWLLLILGLCFIAVCGRFLTLFLGRGDSSQPYITDMVNGAVWRWHWIGGEISGLWCYCPACDAELVYDDSSCNWTSSHLGETRKTDFVCEHCRKSVIASVEGGDKDYAIKFVKRELRRRMRVQQAKAASAPPAVL